MGFFLSCCYGVKGGESGFRVLILGEFLGVMMRMPSICEKVIQNCRGKKIVEEFLIVVHLVQGVFVIGKKRLIRA